MQTKMASRLAFEMDSGCLAFCFIFVFLSNIIFYVVEDWQMKFFLSTLCLVFLFLCFVLDAWKSQKKEEEWMWRVLNN